MSESAVDVLTKVKINTDIKLPAMFSVIYFNDDKTTSTFVAQSLIDIFGYSISAAVDMTKTVDEKGSGVVATGLAKELASHLRDLVIVRARSENFPLVVEIKEE